MYRQNDILKEATGKAADYAGGQKLVVAGGLLGALAASSCCVLPLVLFSIGAGGAWIGELTALAPYQPLFGVITLSLLSYGFWLVYLAPAVACREGEACGRPLPNLLVKTGLWAATVIVAAALGFPFVAPILLGT
jgi:mercuric ion transport protein